MDPGLRSTDPGKAFLVINVKYSNSVCCILKIILAMSGVLSPTLAVALSYIATTDSGPLMLRRCLKIGVNEILLFTIFGAIFSPHQASFSYFNNPPTNMQRLITSGGFVTFSLTRDSPNLFGYGFVIQVTPIPGNNYE